MQKRDCAGIPQVCCEARRFPLRAQMSNLTRAFLNLEDWEIVLGSFPNRFG